MTKRIITIIAILIIFALSAAVLFNTFSKEENNGLTKVKVAEVAHSIFYAPQYAAIANGYFEEQGIEIDLTLVPGGV
jgi:NitT/TauT family transport system substrate-binding protein